MVVIMSGLQPYRVPRRGEVVHRDEQGVEYIEVPPHPFWRALGLLAKPITVPVKIAAKFIAGGDMTVHETTYEGDHVDHRGATFNTYHIENLHIHGQQTSDLEDAVAANSAPQEDEPSAGGLPWKLFAIMGGAGALLLYGRISQSSAPATTPQEVVDSCTNPQLTQQANKALYTFLDYVGTAYAGQPLSQVRTAWQGIDTSLYDQAVQPFANMLQSAQAGGALGPGGPLDGQTLQQICSTPVSMYDPLHQITSYIHTLADTVTANADQIIHTASVYADQVMHSATQVAQHAAPYMDVLERIV